MTDDRIRPRLVAAEQTLAAHGLHVPIVAAHDELIAEQKELREQLASTYTQRDLDFAQDNTDEYAARAFKAEARLAKLTTAVQSVINEGLLPPATQDELETALDDPDQPE